MYKVYEKKQGGQEWKLSWESKNKSAWTGSEDGDAEKHGEKRKTNQKEDKNQKLRKSWEEKYK